MTHTVRQPPNQAMQLTAMQRQAVAQDAEPEATVRMTNCSVAQSSNQAMQLTASKPDVYAGAVCRRRGMLRIMRRGLAAADLVTRQFPSGYFSTQ